MSTNTGIEWTDNTFNVVHGCSKVSDACLYCYAWVEDKRLLHERFTHWEDAPRMLMADDYWAQPYKWNRDAERENRKTKVFCSSMCDVFESHPTVDQERQNLWPLIEQTPHLIWQLLTKRPQSIMQMVPQHWRERFPKNVWAMATAENQECFDIRVKHLLKVPASVLGFSCEPLLEPIEFGRALDGIDPKRLWVIAGGESSHDKVHCRPTKYEWFTRLRDQCVERSIPFFFKQWGNFHEDVVWHQDKSYRLLDGREWNEYPPH